MSPIDKETKEKARERAKAIAAEFEKRGDPLGWFEELYSTSAGDNEAIPWADLEPNRYFADWAGSRGLEGSGRSALVVGCGLGDDAALLNDLGFRVTAFDISHTAIEWARRIYGGRGIDFEVGDLLHPPQAWIGAFEFVLEIYTIQPLPIEMRSEVMDSIASFVADGGELVVVSRGRDEDSELAELPWPISREELEQFKTHGLIETDFSRVPGEPDEPDRFIVRYEKR